MAKQIKALFAEVGNGKIFASEEQKLKAEIDQIDEDELVSTNLDDWVNYFKNKYNLKAPKIIEEEMNVGFIEANVRVNSYEARRFGISHAKGLRYTLHAPYDGDSRFFHFRPSTYSLNFPRAVVEAKYLEFQYDTLNSNGNDVKHYFEEQIKLVNIFIDYTKDDVFKFNNALPLIAKTHLEERKNRILKGRNIAATLRFPLRERKDALIIPSQPVKLKPMLVRPQANATSFEPEPALDGEQYEQILKTLSNMSLLMERNPETFKTLDEEAIRDHFLLQLNGQFEGAATGETFNRNGKTDILIRERGKTIFIGECKFWKGTKKFSETVDQLLGYTSWRDTKTAILVFNKNKNTSSVVEEIKKAVEEHANFKRWSDKQEEATIRCVLHHPSDKNRELYLAVLIFDVPK